MSRRHARREVIAPAPAEEPVAEDVAVAADGALEGVTPPVTAAPPACRHAVTRWAYVGGRGVRRCDACGAVWPIGGTR